MERTKTHSPLRRARFAAGDPPLREVARQTGIDASEISRMERDVRSPSFQNIAALAQCYGLGASDLAAQHAEWVTETAADSSEAA